MTLARFGDTDALSAWKYNLTPAESPAGSNLQVVFCKKFFEKSSVGSCLYDQVIFVVFRQYILNPLDMYIPDFSPISASAPALPARPAEHVSHHNLP